MSEHYFQECPHCFLELCCLLSADPAWFGVGKPTSAARNRFTRITFTMCSNIAIIFQLLWSRNLIST